MQPEDRGQKTEDRIVVAAAPHHLHDRAALRHTKPLSSALCPLSSDERGSTLIISLIILIILMLLGVTAMNTSNTQYKLAGNLQFENMATNQAETSANTAERWLETNAAATPSASAVAVLPNPLTNMAWTDADSVQVVAGDDTQRYVIGYVSTNASPLAGVGLDCFDPSNEHNFDCVHTYLVTARGQGGRGATKFVQTYYAVPLK